MRSHALLASSCCLPRRLAWTYTAIRPTYLPMSRITANASLLLGRTCDHFSKVRMLRTRHLCVVAAREGSIPVSASPRSKPQTVWQLQLYRHASSATPADMAVGVSLQKKSSPVDFDDTSVAFGAVPTKDLLRALLVFKMCSIRPLVAHADTMLKQSYNIFGKTVTETIVRHTFFTHFCAGEDATTIRPRVEALGRAGVHGILDYAAEADIHQMTQESSTTAAYAGGDVQCRVYDYTSERTCDAHVETFMECIRAVKDVTPEGFAAIKVTALGNPVLLERISTCILEVRRLFEAFDRDRKGYITRAQFREGYEKYFVASNDGVVDRLLARLDPLGADKIDYIEWSNTLRLEDLPALTSRCREAGPLTRAVLSAEETVLMQSMRNRLDKLASAAASYGVRLMIDAEQTYFQPAIDSIITEFQKRYNLEYPVIYGTYQCYLKDSHARLRDDMDRASRQGYHFAAKLVRGAYLISERKRASEKGYPSPIHETIDDTHRSYDRAVEIVLGAIARGEKVEILVASHNQRSVEKALARMDELGLDRSRKIHFGQLLGMADHLSLALGKNGFKAFKYVPYGRVGEVLPYLIRRAQENSDMLGGVSKDVSMVKKELKRRALGLLGWR